MIRCIQLTAAKQTKRREKTAKLTKVQKAMLSRLQEDGKVTITVWERKDKKVLDTLIKKEYISNDKVKFNGTDITFSL